jgi:hypothetical protein
MQGVGSVSVLNYASSALPPLLDCFELAVTCHCCNKQSRFA